MRNWASSIGEIVKDMARHAVERRWTSEDTANAVTLSFTSVACVGTLGLMIWFAWVLITGGG